MLSVSYKVLEQFMVDLLLKEVTGETLAVHIALHTDAAARRFQRVSKPLYPYMEPIATFIRAKLKSPMEEKRYGITYASTHLGGTIATFNEEAHHFQADPTSLMTECQERVVEMPFKSSL